MMDKKIIFDDFSNNLALWCGTGLDASELARVADVVMKRKLSVISVQPDSIKTIWPWIENVKTTMLARFYMSGKKITEQQVSDVTEMINVALKNGADGAQIFLPYLALNSLVEQTHIVRDDMFFNKHLSIGLDINEIDTCDWKNLFESLQKINASSLVLILGKDIGDKSDFVGRIYGMLYAWDTENNFDLHFVLGHDFCRIEQVLRLIKSERPQLLNSARFFVSY
jgi:hypothetical protein